MKKCYLTLCFLVIAAGSLFAQCTETDKPRVLLVGDSWANMMNTDNTINSVFDRWGHSNYTFYTNSTLAENGTRTTDFIQQNRLDEIQNQLLSKPTIDFVHLSIGGNDVLNQWHKNWSQAKTDSLLDSVYNRLNVIINFVKNVKPGMKILWSGYAYPNFGEIIGEMAPFQATHPFYGTWNGMGQPTFIELNTILNYFSDTVAALAALDPQVDFVMATGVMQYSFGQPTNLSVPPGGNYPAFTAPLPLGFPDYPSPKASMRNYVLFRDCFHLSADGFSAFVNYQSQKYYHKALMDDQYILSSGGTQDGSVSDLGTVSPLLQLGSSAGEEFSLALSFNTTLMPDTGVSAASIFLRRESLSGTNPIGNSLQVSVKSGNFGATIDVEASDYSDPGDAFDAPCQFGTSNANGGWIRLELPAALLPYITFGTTTQFKISAPGAAGLVTFTDASDNEFSPVLNLTYGPVIVSLTEVTASGKTVNVYPNPTTGIVVFDSEGLDILDVEVYDLPGRMVLNSGIVQRSLDLSGLPTGMYVLKINTVEGSLVKRIVKK